LGVDWGEMEFIEGSSGEILKEFGLKIVYSKNKLNQPLQGKKFVFTGSLSVMTREAATQKIRNLGGQISGNVSLKTDFLVYGKNSGSKYQKAKKVKIRTLSESQFLQFLKDKIK